MYRLQVLIGAIVAVEEFAEFRTGNDRVRAVQKLAEFLRRDGTQKLEDTEERQHTRYRGRCGQLIGCHLNY